MSARPQTKLYKFAQADLTSALTGLRKSGAHLMFIWDFAAIFSIVLIFCLGLVLALWIIYNLKRKEVVEQKVSEFLKHCKYCGYVYLDYHLRNACQCPRCLSYHE